MKRMWLLATVLCVWPELGVAQTTAELNNDGKDPQNVITQSMGYDRKNYSPLKEINKSNVKRLVPVWTTSLMNDFGELSAPTLYNGVLYAHNSRWTFAIDIETGRQIWRTPVQLEPGSAAGTQYGTATRGATTIYNGKVFRTTQDNHLVALDMKTGKEMWNQRFAEWREGYSASSSPIVANGVVISGMAGGESTVRGFLDGWDPETGKKLWRRYTVPAPGEPGSETWPNNDAWKTGGGPTWRSGSYDPQLDLVYWGTGNAEPYDPRPRQEKDSLFTSSVIAIRPKTGEIVCYYQYTPNDVYDVDGVDELVLADIPIDGQPRKVMIQANKNGFLYVIDRTNCKLIAAHPFTRVNWASQIDLKTGRPVLTELYKRFLGGEEVEIYPQRGINAVPIAFNPNNRLVYATSWNLPRIQKLGIEPVPPEIGKRYTLVNGRQVDPKPGEPLGHILAINPLTGQKKWEIPLMDMPSASGVLSTAGGVVFTGKLTGEFMALDEDTGKVLWQFKTQSGVNSTAITYMYKGRQYVTVASGLGGGAKRFAADTVPTGGAMWTFALMPE